MTTIALPLSIQRGRIARTESPTEAITAYLSQLITTPRYLTAADPNFGFVFNNLKFENVNENEGVVYNKKLSGSSKNLNTFAAELQKMIQKYELRLENVKVNMTYVREEKKIYTTVTGIIKDTQEDYQYKTMIKVWH